MWLSKCSAWGQSSRTRGFEDYIQTDQEWWKSYMRWVASWKSSHEASPQARRCPRCGISLHSASPEDILRLLPLQPQPSPAVSFCLLEVWVFFPMILEQIFPSFNLESLIKGAVHPAAMLRNPRSLVRGNLWRSQKPDQSSVCIWDTYSQTEPLLNHASSISRLRGSPSPWWIKN